LKISTIILLNQEEYPFSHAGNMKDLRETDKIASFERGAHWKVFQKRKGDLS